MTYSLPPLPPLRPCQRRLSERTRTVHDVVATRRDAPAGRTVLDIESTDYVAVRLSDGSWAGYSRDRATLSEVGLTPRQVLRRLGLLGACPCGCPHPATPDVVYTDDDEPCSPGPCRCHCHDTRRRRPKGMQP